MSDQKTEAAAGSGYAGPACSALRWPEIEQRVYRRAGDECGTILMRELAWTVKAVRQECENQEHQQRCEEQNDKHDTSTR